MRTTLLPLGALFVGVLVPGCKSAAENRAEADQEVYSILEQRRQQLGFGETRFSIEPSPESLRQRLLAGEAMAPVDLVQSMSIAAENSRDYQSQKEDLYLVTLDLTLERFRFAVQRDGSLAGLLSGDGDGATTASTTGSAGFTKVLGTGAALLGNMGLTLARDLTSADGWDLTSNFALGITQPLLRGFGERIVMEPLTRAERAVVYEVRSFERFRRTFAVDVASRYFRILQSSDVVANERAAMENLGRLRLRNEELADAGRLSDIQVDQARQDELRSKQRLIVAEERMQQQLDEFKLFLGLPIETPLDLDRTDLTALETYHGDDLAESEVVPTALAQRLDYLTALDRVDDAHRQSDVAADALRAALDVAMNVTGLSNDGQPLEFDDSDLRWTLSARFDLPLDRLAERNDYRESLVQMDRSQRSAEELADSIKVGLRDSLRQSIALLESVIIQEGAVTLAERRIESTTLNLQAGRADTRDILEAEDALREARNALTAARIDYYLSQLNLWRDMELLRVDDNGIHFERDLLGVTHEDQP